MLTINFIQDIPTPHNNVLISGLIEEHNSKLNLWYASSTHSKYKWTEDLANKYLNSNIYGSNDLSFKLIKHVIFNRKEKYFMVGWSNPTTRFLLVLVFLTRINFNMWFDFPNDGIERSWLKKQIRELFYFLVKNSNIQIFCVGKLTVQYFLDRGFNEKRLTNFPIIVEVIEEGDLESAKIQKSDIITHHGIDEDNYILMSGSRLTYDKGFDLMITGISKLRQDILDRTTLFIVGQGPEKLHLLELVKSLKLSKNVIFIDWLPIEKFLELVKVSHVFIHPARFDAYGGTIYAMASGIPVIGSKQAGAAFDKIDNGINGFLYDCNDTDRLANCIENLLENQHMRNSFSSAAFLKASFWAPKKASKFLIGSLI